MGMKKWALLIFVIVLLALLLSLSEKPISYPLMQEKDAISQIDIIEIDDYRIISTGNFDMIRIKKNIDVAEHSAFISAFYNLRCNKSLGPSQECLEGKAIRFLFDDGAFQLVGAETSFYCSADNEWSYVAYYFDYEMFYQYLLSIEQMCDKGTVLLSPRKS